MAKALEKLAFPGSFGEVPKSTASATIQGNCLEYKVFEERSAPKGGKRGMITDFSPAARLRMLKHFQKIDFKNHVEPLFMTLTYPDDLAETTHAERNVHRKVMARHLERLTEARICAAWRIEWVARKTGKLIGQYCPHWHWLIFRQSFIHYQDVNSLWKHTIGWKDYCRTEIQRVHRDDCVPLYMAKYISKDAVCPSLVIAAKQSRIGRQYGWLRKRDLPMCPLALRCTLPDSDRDALTKLAVESLPWMIEGQESSFTLFGAKAEDARKIIDGEILDG